MARARKNAKNSGKTYNIQQSVNSLVWSICDIMCRSTCTGAIQYVPELTLILFLCILDGRETKEAELGEGVVVDFTPSLEAPFRWQDWATPGGDRRQELETGAR